MTEVLVRDIVRRISVAAGAWERLRRRLQGRKFICPHAAHVRFGKKEQHPGLERYLTSLNPWRSRTNGMKPRRSPDGGRSTSPAHLHSHSLCGAQTRYSEDDE